MPAPLSESVLRALVGEAHRDGDASGILIASAVPHWAGEAEFDTDWGRVRVAPCVSALAVRDVLAGYVPRPDELLVVLTECSEEEVGQEVLARIWRHRLQRPSRWEAAKQLFRVDRLDPELANARWLVDLLVEVAPARGYPPPPSGFLDFESAWRTLLRHGLRMSVDGPTVADLLKWGETDDARFAMDGPALQYRLQIAEKLELKVDPVARHVLDLVADGHGRDLVPLGLICDVLWASGASSEIAAQTARVRFETPLGTKKLTVPMARSWGDAAVEIFREAAGRRQSESTSRWAARAEALLQDVDAVELAVHSDVLALGFMQRLIRVGNCLSETVVSPSPESLSQLEEALGLVQRHAQAKTELEEDRVRQVRMAARLARWLQLPSVRGVGDLAASAAAFVEEGAWVDTAREAISHGETVSTLAEAYDRLVATIDDKRRERDLTFARALGEWSRILPAESTPLLPIERILDEVVAPVAQQAPVLLLVLDGFSYPEATRLSSDLRDTGWVPNGPEEQALPLVVAALPTVTVISRASLLSGSLMEGGQAAERTGFENNPALRAAGGKPPVLFHKKDLKIEAGRIAPEVQRAILDSEQVVVGVVVNAVDDHLEKGAQLRLADGLKGIRPLRPLLDAAAEAGRVVILVSDHGHVLEYGSKVRPAEGGGERWRPADPPPQEDEVELTGPRVLKAGGRIIAPGVETVRYIPMEKRGYHGGVTPQEVLCPLMVLTTASTSLSGWDRLPAYEPEWWRSASSEQPFSEPPSPTPEPVLDPDGQGILFPEPVSPPPEPPMVAWLEAILASPVLESQREIAGRQALDAESTRAFLTVLGARNGVASPGVLADSLSLPQTRLRTKLEALRRMLNVDGYPVLTIESDGTARLNIDLLRTQFEVSG